MAKKKVKAYYYYPISEVTDSNNRIRICIRSLDDVLEKLLLTDMSDRVYPLDGDDNIQLKKIEKIESIDEKNTWKLCFLKNTKDSFFKGKLEDDTESAEELEEDEFIGQECCMMYDNHSNVICLQNNVRSISYSRLASFFNKFIYEFDLANPLKLSVITLKEEHCEIIEDGNVEYRSIVLNFTDVERMKELAERSDKKSVKKLVEISNSLGALQGKVELSVGRNKSHFLTKPSLKDISDFFKKNKLSSSIKVKVYENDSIRLIDLIDDKLYDEFEIEVTKDDVKTFEKILNPMSEKFIYTLDHSLEKCNIITS